MRNFGLPATGIFDLFSVEDLISKKSLKLSEILTLKSGNSDSKATKNSSIEAMSSGSCGISLLRQRGILI